MQARLFRAIANPPTLMFAPAWVAMGNIMLQFNFWLLFSGIFGTAINPLILGASIVGMHIIIIMWGIKEPHLASIIVAWGHSMRGTSNMLPRKGRNKYVP